MLTVIGLSFAFSLTGAFYVEIIFNWPDPYSLPISFLNLDYARFCGAMQPTVSRASGYIVTNFWLICCKVRLTHALV